MTTASNPPIAPDGVSRKFLVLWALALLLFLLFAGGLALAGVYGIQGRAAVAEERNVPILRECSRLELNAYAAMLHLTAYTNTGLDAHYTMTRQSLAELRGALHAIATLNEGIPDKVTLLDRRLDDLVEKSKTVTHTLLNTQDGLLDTLSGLQQSATRRMRLLHDKLEHAEAAPAPSPGAKTAPRKTPPSLLPQWNLCQSQLEVAVQKAGQAAALRNPGPLQISVPYLDMILSRHSLFRDIGATHPEAVKEAAHEAADALREYRDALLALRLALEERDRIAKELTPVAEELAAIGRAISAHALEDFAAAGAASRAALEGILLILGAIFLGVSGLCALLFTRLWKGAHHDTHA